MVAGAVTQIVYVVLLGGELHVSGYVGVMKLSEVYLRVAEDMNCIPHVVVIVWPNNCMKLGI